MTLPPARLRWRVWVEERLQPTVLQATLLWAALAGFLGALAAILFTALTEDVHGWFGRPSDTVVESMRLLPPWARVLVPALGGAAAGLVLLSGRRLARNQSSTDYMEAIAIGTGRIPVRASLVKSAAALFSIGSGGSIGREGPMVQLAALVASVVGRWRHFSTPRLRLLVACGAAAGIASAYHAPIAGSFFVAEIILGTIAMESLGPLVVSAVAATLTVTFIAGGSALYTVPAFKMSSAWEILPYIALGFLMGALAPAFLMSLRRAEQFIISLGLPIVLRLALGGAVVGTLAIVVPEVCGNGYPVIVDVLNGKWAWTSIVGIFAFKWVATMASFGSGAPGGVFTPALFMGASGGLLFGTAVNYLWPTAAPYPWAFALVGMGAFLSAASHAPVMAMIMLVEMTLSYDIVLPLMLCTVVAYHTARSVTGESLYSDVLKRKEAALPEPPRTDVRVADMMRENPSVISPDARFADVARMFLEMHVNNIYVVDEDRRFLGVVSLHDIKPYVTNADLGQLVMVRDLMREEFPRVAPEQTLTAALEAFIGVVAERLPVVSADGTLRGSLSKSDLLLTLADKPRTSLA